MGPCLCCAGAAVTSAQRPPARVPSPTPFGRPHRLGPHWARLGTLRAEAAGAGNKAALLDRAAQRGLPVPRGFVLLDVAFRRALRERLVTAAGGTVATRDPLALVRTLGLPRFEGRVAVRSAFSTEDGAGESLAGFFTSRLWVDARDPVAFAAALCEVWSSAERRPGSFRRDVLVLAMVDARRAGVAFTEREYEDDLVDYTHGTADTLVSGQVAGESLLLPKLRWWERDAGGGPFPDWARRLQQTLKGVRRVFDADDWDIEWADDGVRCWLVQVRPVTRPPRRNEAFTTANFKEILPDPPSRFAASVVETASGGMFDYYRRFDRSLPAHRAFIALFAGRPLFNISLLSDLMRAWGLPTSLVTDNIGGETDRPFGLNLPRALSKAVPGLRQVVAQLRSPYTSRRARAVFLARSERPGASYGECLDTVCTLYGQVLRVMLGVTAAMSGPLLALRRLGVLEEDNAREQNIATRMYTALDGLRALATARPQDRAALAAGEVPDNPAFRAAWTEFLRVHGARGIYETDIARPRFHEAPAPLLRSLANPAPPRRKPPPRTLPGYLTLPIWWQGARAMRAREEIRYDATIAFDRVRRALLALADRSVAAGQLPSREALWLLEVDEVRRLDTGWAPGAAFFAARTAEIARQAAVRVPDLVHRFDDLEALTAPAATDAARLAGISLTTGEVRGRAWVLREPSTEPPPGFTPDTTILVARSIDAGWIPTFALVAGAVVETGGDLSHGSIILREIGLPAITNVRDATRAIRTGEPLLLHAGRGVVERHDAGSAS